MNKHFWDLVKKMIATNKINCKPCHYYASNKKIVHDEFKKQYNTKKRSKDTKK